MKEELGKARPSFLRRWFGWLLPLGERPSERSGDAFFAPAAAGEPVPMALGACKSTKPPSPLAEAYKQAAKAAQAEPPVELPPPGPPEWKVREPADRSDPVQHTECRVERRSDSWDLLAASVRGKLHAHQGSWRDDAYAWDWAGDWTALAVADGAGSVPLARVGARVSCDRSVRAVRERLADFRPTPVEAPVPGEEDLKKLRSILVEGANEARAAILREAQQRGASPRDFYCTFLLVAHCPFGDADLVAALQVGDGAIALFSGPDRCTVLGEADHGAYGSETRFLTTPGIEEEFGRRTVFAVPRGLRAVAVMTDGVADDFFPEKERLVQLFNGNPIDGLKTRGGEPLVGVLHGAVPQPRDGQALVEWLQYEKKGSSDDRTLVLMVRRQGEGTWAR